MTTRLFRCRVLVDGKVRCGWEGGNESAGEHWRETGHARCTCCGAFLELGEQLNCLRCIGWTRTNLIDITDCVAVAPSVIEGAAYRGMLLIDLLAMTSDGSIESAVQSAHPDLYRGVEMPWDPIPVVAALYGIEQTWREEFGHAARMTDATITSCANYLIEWTERAGRTVLGFDDDHATIRELANRLRHQVGVADDPMRGVNCFDCDGSLVRIYRPPTVETQRRVAEALRPVIAQRHAERTYGVVVSAPFPVDADSVSGTEADGLEDLWGCQRCQRVYEPSEYYLAVRAKLEAEAVEKAG